MRTAALVGLLLFGAAAAARGEGPAAPGAILLLERPRPPGGGGRGSGAGDAAERALVDALRIYTRDLGCQVLAGPGAPGGTAFADVNEGWSRARALGVELMLWLAPRGEPAALYALRVEGGLLHTTPVAADEPEVVARTLALKVRALYPQAGAARPGDWTQLSPPTPAASSGAPPAAAGDGGAPPPPRRGEPAAPSSSSLAGSSAPPVPRRLEPAAPPSSSTPAPSASARAVATPGAPARPVASPAAPVRPVAPVGAPVRSAEPATSVGTAPPAPGGRGAGRQPEPAPPTGPAAAPAAAPAAGVAAVPAAPAASSAVNRRRAGIEVGAGFAVDLPDEPRWSRVGASLRLGVVLGTLPLALQLDGAVTSHTSSVQKVGRGNTTFDSRIEVWDVPIGLALLYRLERGRFVLTVGPRVSLHVVHASADAGLSCPADSPPADCSGARTALSAGAGAVVEGRLELARRLWAALSIGAEALLPEQTFTTASVRAADLGSAQVSFVLGLVWRAY